MKASELMVGDWVFTRGQIEQVTSIYDGYICTEHYEYSHDYYFEPIPITPEILEKNGFMYCKSDGGFCLPTTISYGNWDVDVILFNVTDEYRNNQLHIGTPDDSITILHLMECNHVHELQHALRLCGIEKEIVL